MDFRKSLIISVIFHILILFLFQGIKFEADRPSWVEVSFVTFPDPVEREPDAAPGDPETPVPATPPPSPDRTPAPLDLPESLPGVPVDTSEPSAPPIEADRRAPVFVREVDITRPGRPERVGRLEQPGDDPGEVITGPVARRSILRKPEPDSYPAWAEEAGIEGEVVIRFWVTPEGNVSNVILDTTSGYPDFDSRAMEAVKKYLFSPLSSDQDPEDQWGRITVRYRL